MASSVGGQRARNPVEDCELVWKALPVSGKGVAVQAKAATEIGELRHGEIEFDETSGHRCSYLLCPEEMEDPRAILDHMFLNPKGWRLRPPNLVIFGVGGRNHYVNWKLEVENMAAWGEDGEADFKKTRRFDTRVPEIAASTCQALAECQGWFYFDEAGRSGMSEVISDGLMVHWQTHRTLSGHKTDIVAYGIRDLSDPQFPELAFLKEIEANAVSTKQSIRGRLRYPSMKADLFPEMAGGRPLAETIEQRLRVEARKEASSNGAAKAAPSSQARTTKLVSGSLCQVPESELAAQAAEEDDDLHLEEGAAGSVVSGSAWRDTAGDGDRASFAVFKKFLLPTTTHLIICKNKHLHHRLELAMGHMSTLAVIAANGPERNITPGPAGILLNMATKGSPVVLLHYTGGAAEKLADAVQRKRDPLSSSQVSTALFNLPENVPESSFIILNAAKDTTEKVIDKLTTVLSSTRDEEMREVGYSQAERQRLTYAWETSVVYHFNAEQQWRLASRLQHSILAISLLTTAATLSVERVSRGCDSGEDSTSSFFSYLCLPKLKFGLVASAMALPVLSSFLLQINSKFNPITKWSYLEHARLAIVSEIYQFRTRCESYASRDVSSQDPTSLVEELLRKDAIMTGYHADWTPPAHPARQQGSGVVAEDAKGSGGACDVGAGGQQLELDGPAAPRPRWRSLARRTRRELFAEKMNLVTTSTLSSELNTDSLAQPPHNLFENTLGKLFDSRKFLPGDTDGGCFKRMVAWLTRDCCPPPAGGPSAKGGNSDYNYSTVSLLVEDILIDDGLSTITADDYITFRLMPQLHMYMQTVSRLTKVHSLSQVCIFVLTASATLLVMMQMNLLVPLVVALTTSIQSAVNFAQLAPRIRNLNASVLALKNLRVWWQSLSMVQMRLPVNKNHLVSVTESTVDAEVSCWMKSMIVQNKPQNDGEGSDDEEEKGGGRKKNK